MHLNKYKNIRRVLNCLEFKNYPTFSYGLEIDKFNYFLLGIEKMGKKKVLFNDTLYMGIIPINNVEFLKLLPIDIFEFNIFNIQLHSSVYSIIKEIVDLSNTNFYKNNLIIENISLDQLDKFIGFFLKIRKLNIFS